MQAPAMESLLHIICLSGWSGPNLLQTCFLPVPSVGVSPNKSVVLLAPSHALIPGPSVTQPVLECYRKTGGKLWGLGTGSHSICLAGDEDPKRGR